MSQQRNRKQFVPPIMLASTALLVLGLACSLGPLQSTPSVDAETQVPATTSAQTAAPTQPAETDPRSDQGTPTAPAGGVSLNCDGTYQRVRVETIQEGRALFIDQRQGGEWRQSWSYDVGDDQEAQLGERAGAHSFGGCERLIVIPVDYQGTGGFFQIRVFRWTSDGPEVVFARDGIPGDWTREGDSLIIRRTVYLHDEPLCCPCNYRVTTHRWNGTDFVQEEEQLEPAYTGTPPPPCTS